MYKNEQMVGFMELFMRAFFGHRYIDNPFKLVVEETGGGANKTIAYAKSKTKGL